ncbi:hypothetical protein RUND412_005676 [Rhizina undulata]
MVEMEEGVLVGKNGDGEQISGFPDWPALVDPELRERAKQSVSGDESSRGGNTRRRLGWMMDGHALLGQDGKARGRAVGTRYVW